MNYFLWFMALVVHIKTFIYFWFAAVLCLLIVTQIMMQKVVGAKRPGRMKEPVSSVPVAPEHRKELATERRRWIFSLAIQFLFLGVIGYGLWSLGKFGGQSCNGEEVDVAKLYCNIFGSVAKKEGDVAAAVAPSPMPTRIPAKIHVLPASANYRPENLAQGKVTTVCERMEAKKINCRLTDGGFPDAVILPSEFNGHFNAHLVQPSGVPLDEQWVYYKWPDGTINGPEFPAPSPELSELAPVTNSVRIQGKGTIQFTAH